MWKISRKSDNSLIFSQFFKTGSFFCPHPMKMCMILELPNRVYIDKISFKESQLNFPKIDFSIVNQKAFLKWTNWT